MKPQHRHPSGVGTPTLEEPDHNILLASVSESLRRYGFTPTYSPERFGQPLTERSQGGLMDHSKFMGKAGIIYFDFGERARGASFTGHVDLWNGSSCVGNCGNYIYEAERVMLWEVSR